MNKTAIKNFAVWARKKLIADICYRAQLLGITKEGIKDSLPQSTGSVQFFDIGTAQPYSIGGAAISQRAHLADAIRQKAQESDYKTAYQSIVEEVAYTWFNRLIAVRFMEVNDYLPSHLRVLSSESGKLEPDLVTRPFDADFAFSERERAEVARMQQNNAVDELFCLLFIKQCNALHELLPALFERTRDYTELLLSLSVVDREGVVYHLVHDIPEEDFDVSRGGQVEIIGWLYQHYISEKHEEVVDPLHGREVKKDDIPAATQLFTTDWVVRYMVDNSLGRYWIERHPESTLLQKLQYFVRPKSGEIEYLNETMPCKLQELTFFDPCMGSGHILVYAFDVLMQIYVECGYSERDAAAEIVRNNLFGLDIDRRAMQLAYFSVMMKARQYDRRFLSRGIHPQVYCPTADGELTEYGSMTQVQALGAKPVLPAGATLFEQDYNVKLNDWNVRRVLAKTYKVVCTNPPYLNKYNAKLKEFVNETYKDYSGDLFSVFIYRNLQLCEEGGYCGYMTPNVWMFIKTYEKLRLFLLKEKSIVSLVQMAKGAFFKEATVDICAFVLQNAATKQAGLYFRLEDFKGDMEVQRQKVLGAIANPNCGYFYEAQQANFSKIPGSPIAYWVSEKILDAYSIGKLFGDTSDVKIGMGTGKNDIFVREWWEINCKKIDYSLTDISQLDLSKARYFPYNKGGEFRLWYGNLQEVLWFDTEGRTYMNTMSGHRENGAHDWYCHEGLTWSFISSSKFGVRYLPTGCFFDVAGSTVFSRIDNKYTLGFLSSCVCFDILRILNPTLNYQAGNIKSLPIIFSRENEVDSLVDSNINLSKYDWDSYETSWDFKKHPLV